MRSAVEWVLIIAAALGVAFVVRTFLFQPFFIPSASMEPELNVGDRIIVNKLSYRMHEINRGDVVVFVRPACEAGGTTKDLVKRVIGLEGETVQGRNGTVEVGGRPIPEDYLPEGQTTSDFGPVTVPEGHIWVMGDNRENSKDSRTLCNARPTFIDEDDVLGRAFVRVWPPTHLGIL
ncbi:MAG TPA: signal peptidase I [Acidimicrobiales bacterium]|nr:signal peptidase I [Acidimicrobiales bacterium]